MADSSTYIGDHDLVELLGEEAALAFFNAYAGNRIFIGRGEQTRRDYGIAECIGEEAAQKLFSVFWGDYIRVPLAREFRIKMFVKRHWSMRQITIALGMTDNGVYGAMKRMSGG